MGTLAQSLFIGIREHKDTPLGREFFDLGSLSTSWDGAKTLAESHGNLLSGGDFDINKEQPIKRIAPVRLIELGAEPFRLGSERDGFRARIAAALTANDGPELVKVLDELQGSYAVLYFLDVFLQRERAVYEAVVEAELIDVQQLINEN